MCYRITKRNNRNIVYTMGKGRAKRWEHLEGMTVKEYNWANEYINNGANGTKASLKVYDCDYKTAQTIASENMAKEPIKAFIESHLHRLGTPEWIEQQIVKDIMSDNPQIRARMLELLAKVRSMVTEKRINVEEQKKELGAITYSSFEEGAPTVESTKGRTVHEA